MKAMAGCFLSALAASLLTAWMINPAAPDQARAQDFGLRSGPRIPLGRPPAAPPGLADAPLPELSPEEQINVAVYETVNKSVVNITTRSTKLDGFFLLELSAEGSGSGSILDHAGHILTNYHVIEDAREVAVTLYNGKTYDATFVGADPINDLAVIKIDAPKDVLFPVTLGDSRGLRVGMRVFAIGNPFGLERTMTTGIISSLNRSLQIRGNRTIKSIIQIDAAVNPGNSGGPLLDSRGQLIGINTAIASRNGQSAGVGFAIPVNLVSRVVAQLVRHGRVIRPEIGIQRVYETEQGLLIARLTPGGPAERAGLQGPRTVRTKKGVIVLERIDRSAADLIVEVDGQEVKTAYDFLGYIEGKRVGETIELTILRDNKRLRVPVQLGGSEPLPRATPVEPKP